jgi:PAS domain S-box-containing protein
MEISQAWLREMTEAWPPSGGWMRDIKGLIDALPVGIGLCAVNGGRVSDYVVNERLTAMLGVAAEDVMSLDPSAADQVHDDDRQAVFSMIAQLRRKMQGQCKFRFAVRPGEYRWFQAQLQGIRSDDGVFASICIQDIDKGRRTQEYFTKTYQIYNAALEEAQLIAWEYDMERHRVIVADRVLQKKDAGRNRLSKVIDNVPESLLPYVDPADRQALLSMYRELDAGRARASCSVWYRLEPDEEPRCARITYLTIYDDQGLPVSAFGLMQNITAQKKEEEKYALAYRQLDEAHPYYLGSFHLNLTKNWCGNGQSPLEFVLKQQESGTVDGYFQAFSQLIADEGVRAEFFGVFDREKLIRRFQEGDTSVSIQYPIVYDNGERHWRDALLYMLQNPKTGDIEAVTYAIDIDAQKRNEFILEHFIEDPFDQIGLIHPREKTYEFYSKDEAAYYGQKQQAVDYEKSRQYVRDNLLAPEDIPHFDHCVALETILSELRKHGTYATAYKRTIAGEASYLHIQYDWLEEPEGDILVFQTNVTESVVREQQQLRKIESALLEADRANEAKSAFLASMSHDLRTPLNGVIAFTDFALKEEDPAKKQDYLEKVKSSGALLHDLIDDTLELSRIESGKTILEPEPASGREMAMNVITALRPSAQLKDITLIAKAEEFPDETIWVDRLKAQKILLNLLSNAIKYTPRGGQVRCRLERIDPPEDGRNCRLIVEDTGIGMSSGFLKRLYEPFAQERRAESAGVQGTGLGLAIVKRYVDLMDGRIQVQSTLKKGTRFIVELPLEIFREKPADAGKVRNREVNLQGRKVLVCEDNYLNREIAQIILKDKGVVVECAEDGQAGLARFAASSAGYYDALLMDIRMPVMDGIETTRAIRALGRPDALSVPIIAMTADAFEETVAQAKAAGMDAYITKPIDPKGLIETLGRCIAQR